MNKKQNIAQKPNTANQVDTFISQPFDSEFYDGCDSGLDCPCCGKEYDEIDYDYQICHFCGCDAEK